MSHTVVFLALQAATDARAASDSALAAHGNPISPVTILAIVVLAFALGAHYRRRRSRRHTPPEHR